MEGSRVEDGEWRIGGGKIGVEKWSKGGVGMRIKSLTNGKANRSERDWTRKTSKDYRSLMQ